MKFKLNYIFTIVFLLSLVKATLAQTDKVEAQRVAFISKEVNITPAEAQSFWPLYNEYNDKIKSARRSFRQQYGGDSEISSDKEAEEFLSAQQKLKQNEVDLRKEYTEKFKKILGVKKTAQLFKAEEKFVQILVNTAKGGKP